MVDWQISDINSAMKQEKNTNSLIETTLNEYQNNTLE